MTTEDNTIDGEFSNELIVASATHVPAEEQTADTRSVSPFRDVKAFETAQRMAKMLAYSTIVPVAFQGNVSNCVIALEMAHRTGITPTMVMQNIYIINGKPSWSSQFIIAVINASGRFSQLEFIFNEDRTECHCEAIRLSTGKVAVGVTVSTQMAREEGWSTKSGSKWRTMPELMIQYRAAAFFGRLHCPDLLLGLYSEYEQTDITNQVRGAA